MNLIKIIRSLFKNKKEIKFKLVRTLNLSLAICDKLNVSINNIVKSYEITGFGNEFI